jgi:hypothetical protein
MRGGLDGDEVSKKFQIDLGSFQPIMGFLMKTSWCHR